jgi:thiamine biosynthesis protein ThiI
MAEGRILALISGGIDSAVAAYMASFKGKLEVHALNFNIEPYMKGEETVKPYRLCLKLRESIPLQKLYIIPHGRNLTKIISRCNRKLTCVICKRLMLRVASKLALKINALAIVTGDSLGQVASQTLTNLVVEDEASAMPILRPLIGLNKNEIVTAARKIGTYEISALKPQTCKAAPLNPATEAKLEVVKSEEEKLPIAEMVEEALKAREEHGFEEKI